MIIKFFIFITAVFSMADWGYPEINDSVVLTPLNHDAFIREYEEALVYYYLPKCKYCVVINKFFDDLALEWKEKETRIPFAKFNCSKHIDFCEEHAIPVFPFIKFYIRGHPIPYYGRRLKFHLDKFINDIIYKQPTTISVPEVKAKLETHSPFLLFFGRQKSKLFHFFDLNSKYHREKEFYFIENYTIEELKEANIFRDHHFELTKFSDDIFMFHESQVYYFDKVESFDNIDHFIHKVTHPNIMELGYNFESAYSSDPAQFFIIFVKNLQEPILADFDKFANDHKKEINFLVASQDTYNTKQLKRLKDILLIDDDEIPCVRILVTSLTLEGATKYKFPEELSYQNFHKFLRVFRSSDIQPYLKVEDLNKEYIGNVKLLNAYSFQAQVFVSGQDSIVLYHKDFDRDSKSMKFLQILEKLSAEAEFKSVKFFAINAELNELKHFYHDQPPLLILYSKKDFLNPLYYEEEPKLKKVKKFISSKKNLVKKESIGRFFEDL